MLINIIPTKMLRRIHVIFALNKYSLSAHSIKTYIHRYRNINDGTTLQLWREQPSLVCGFTAVHLALQVFYYKCCRSLLWVFGCYFFFISVRMHFHLSSFTKLVLKDDFIRNCPSHCTIISFRHVFDMKMTHSNCVGWIVRVCIKQTQRKRQAQFVIWLP